MAKPLKATELYCEKCGKVKPDTRPAPDVVKASGAFAMLCSWCWMGTGPRDDR